MKTKRIETPSGAILVDRRNGVCGYFYSIFNGYNRIELDLSELEKVVEAAREMEKQD